MLLIFKNAGLGGNSGQVSSPSSPQDMPAHSGKFVSCECGCDTLLLSFSWFPFFAEFRRFLGLGTGRLCSFARVVSLDCVDRDILVDNLGGRTGTASAPSSSAFRASVIRELLKLSSVSQFS